MGIIKNNKTKKQNQMKFALIASALTATLAVKLQSKKASLKDVDADFDGQLDLAEYTRYVEELAGIPAGAYPEELKGDLKSLFDMVDGDHTGKISAEELNATLHSVNSS